MTEYIDIEVKGLRETNNQLRLFGSLIQKKAALTMTRTTASYLARVIRKNCPVRTGNLKKSIRLSQIKKGDHKTISYIVGFTVGKKAKYDGSYAHLVEFGSAPHMIPRKGERKLMRVGPNYFWGPISHPGHRGSRFVTRSFEEGYAKAIKLGEKAFERTLKKQVR